MTDRKLISRLRSPEDNPIFSAAIGALIYVLIAAVYIFLSGRIAATFAGSIEQLQAVETVKGIAFVFITGILFFFISLGWWRKTHQQRLLLIQSERLALASTYSAVLAHDLNNMLGGLTWLVEGLKEHEKIDPTLSNLQTSVEHAISNLTSLSRRIASTARQAQLSETAAVDLPVALGQILELAGKHPDVRLCHLKINDIQPDVVPLNRGLLEQAVFNLIVNAAQAAGTNGNIEFVAKRINNAISLQIHDSGPGIPPDKIQTVFGVGFTTKSEGSGLGLLSVQAFAASCLGKISVSRSHLGGAVFELLIPLSR